MTNDTFRPTKPDEQTDFQARLRATYEEMAGRLRRVMRSGRFSFRFQLDLALCDVTGQYNTLEIVDEVARLEGSDSRPSPTKPERPFKGEHLSGLWHKHHFQARFIPRNLLNELRRSDVVKRALSPHIGEIISQEVISHLVHEAVVGNFEARGQAQRLTGEWIVFRKEDGRNRYLTLATHREPGGDAAIAERIRQAEEIEARVHK